MIEHRWRTWRTAMHEALYGEGGFYLASNAPARNFRTSAHIGKLWATAIQSLAAQIDTELGEPTTFTVVDVGAGGGELLTALAESAPARWQLHGVDLAPRPDGLPERITWSTEAPPEIEGLLIANELLDVVPVDVIERVDGWPRQVEVTPDGDEEIGGMVTGRDAHWLSVWWPLAEDGDRAEIGWARDDLWRSLTARVSRGLAVAIDYAADPSHDVAGTLTGYRDGHQVMPTPDGTCDLTAHVVFNSLVEPSDYVLSQREVLLALGLSAQRPTYDGEPASYLADLSSAGDAAELLDPNGLGDFTWLLHPVGVNLAANWDVGGS